jgi:GNAT superfamily N-acetyltransferase
MSSAGRSLFASVDLGARIERTETEFIAAAGRSAAALAGHDDVVMPIGGGVAVFAGPDSPFNKVAGLGFDGIPNAAQLDEVEATYADRNTPVQVELSILGDPALPEVLASRGYRVAWFENVLGRDLVPDPAPTGGSAIVVRRADDAVPTWMDVVVEASMHPDTDGVVQQESFSREILELTETASLQAGARLYLAEIDKAPAGGASMHVANGVAMFTGAATLPSYRRRGVQSALLQARLADAAAAGCDIAIVTTQPGSPSHANAQKAGFDLLYTRAVLVK